MSKGQDGHQGEEQSCPYCKSSVDRSALARAEKQLEIQIQERIRDEGRKKDSEFRELVRDLRVRHQQEIRDVKLRARESERKVKEKFVTSARKEKEAHRREVVKVRRLHHEKLQKLRDSYDREILRLQKDQESAFNLQLKEIIKNYGDLASGHQKELERLKKLHDESDDLIRKKESEISKLRIELAQSASKLEVKELMIQLQERNATIERLNLRIEELEHRFALQQRQTPVKATARPMTDEEQREKLKEYMRAIIEITRNQQAEKRQTAASADENEEKSNEQVEESKPSRLLGWFL